MKNFGISLMLATMPLASWAMDRDGRGALPGDDLMVLYNFEETSGPVLDISGNGSPLNLTIADPSRVSRQAGYIQFNGETVLHSSAPATKIAQRCNQTNEWSVELWIRNQRTAQAPEGVNRLEEHTIFSIARNTPPSNLREKAPESLSLRQSYDAGDRYQISYRASNNVHTRDTNTGIVMVQDLQRIILTHDKNGFSQIYTSNADGRMVIQGLPVYTGTRMSWDDQYYLALGNEVSAMAGHTVPTLDKRHWLGQVHLLAVYCSLLEPDAILGIAAPTSPFQPVPIDLDNPITPAQEKAALLHRRLNSVRVPIDASVIAAMAQKIEAGDWLGAANLATADAGFYNLTVRDFASRMSTRDETVNAVLNDFTATVIGATRDNISAKELLYGNFYYAASADKASVPSNVLNDIVLSNKHYEALEEQKYNLVEVLERVNGQKLHDGNGQVVANPDPAGIITSRAFLEAHATAGTNRRPVEFAFRQFLCSPIEQWADSNGPDSFIGRDIDRFPAGNHRTFQVSCKSCHTSMDSMRPAFGKITFAGGFIRHTEIIRSGDSNADEEGNPRVVKQNSHGIVSKLNHNSHIFPGGYEVTSTNWINYAKLGANAAKFGWNDDYMSGDSIHDFGRMIAESKKFPDCMARRAFRSVCKRDAVDFDEQMIQAVANKFANEDNYSLRKLFERVAITPECLGQDVFQ